VKGFNHRPASVLIVLLLVALISGFQSVGAQDRATIPRIGIITTGSPEALAHLLDGFQEGLRQHGYVDGQNVRLEVRYAEGKAERLSVFAKELASTKVDVIVAIPNPSIQAAQQATQTIPIVMPIGSDPVGAGFVNTLARPGRNITGLSAYSPELNGKRLEFLKESLPKLSQVALLVSGNFPGNAIDLKDTEAAARSMQLQTHLLEVRDTSDLAAVFKTIVQKRIEAATVFPGQPTLFANRKQVVEFGAKYRLPIIYPLADYVVGGGLMSYGVNNLDLFRRAASYVDKILKGANPAELPVEQPTKFELVINLKAAKQIGITIPPNVLARADRVIK
jgi:putative tryptophan/tyrosine transport system substrate-binding protein